MRLVPVGLVAVLWACGGSRPSALPAPIAMPAEVVTVAAPATWYQLAGARRRPARAWSAASKRDRDEVVVELDAHRVRVTIDGASDARVFALQQQETDRLEQESRRAEAQQHRVLCTCRHLRVGETWPHDPGGTRRDPAEERYRIVSTDPAHCAVDVEVTGGWKLDQPGSTRRSMTCDQFVEPRACPMCGAGPARSR